MIGKLYISGTIGEDVNVLDVMNQFKKLENINELEVVINSVGGYVDEGFAIHDYLVGLNLPIHTIASGMCASIATVVFLAGNKRSVAEGCEFMIHAPMVQPDFALNSKELKEWSDGLAKTEKQLIDFYTKKTKLDKNDLDILFKKDTFLNIEQLASLGFTTLQLRPVAYLNINKNPESMTEQDKSWFENQLKAIAKLFTSNKAKAIMLQDSNGVTIEFPDVAEGTLPAVGDTATVEGAPAEGSYIMPQLDNATVVFIGGVVTEIVTAEPNELDLANQKIAELQAKLNAETTARAEAIAKLETASKSFNDFKAQVQSKFQVDPKKDPNPEPPTVRKLMKD